ncbi:MAG: trimeric intracellular cation channel family protein [Crocinitomicaceae bacterium]
MLNLIYTIDLLGTLVFAISGTMAARAQKMDIFGASVIAFVTAVGGGTLRDVMIGSTPVGWAKDLNYLLVILVGFALAIIFRHGIIRFSKTLFLFDAIGIGMFSILGIQKTLSLGLSPVVALMMGVVSAVFGGVIRDILANRVPLIFRKEVYATACIAGGGLFLLLNYLAINEAVNILLCIITVIALRILAVKFSWSLPRLNN